MLPFFTNLSLMEFQVRSLVLLLLFTVVDGVEWFWMASLHKNIQVPLLGPTLFLLYTNDLPDDIICDVAVYADDTTLYSKCDRASDLWQQLELASELQSDLRDTVDWDKKWLADFNDGKTQLVLFDRSNNTGSVDVEMHGSVLEENHLLRCWG